MRIRKFSKRKQRSLISYINKIKDPFLRELFIYRPLLIEKMFNKNLNSIKKNNLLNPSLNWRNYYTKKGKFNNESEFVKKFFWVLHNNFLGFVGYDDKLRIYSLDGIENDGTNIFDEAFSCSYDILKFSDIIYNVFGLSVSIDEALYAFVFSIEEGKNLSKIFGPEYYDLSTGKAIAIDEEDLYYEFEVR